MGQGRTKNEIPGGTEITKEEDGAEKYYVEREGKIDSCGCVEVGRWIEDRREGAEPFFFYPVIPVQSLTIILLEREEKHHSKESATKHVDGPLAVEKKKETGNK